MGEAVPHFVWFVMAELVDRLRATDTALDVETSSYRWRHQPSASRTQL
jgi:hypothetical protein